MSTPLIWKGPHPSECPLFRRVAYSYDRSNPTLVAASIVNHAVHKAMPQVESLLKQATKVTYRFSNSSHHGTHLFFYISPRFSTDYIVIDVDIKDSSNILVSMNWVPFEPGTQIVDFKNMESVKTRSKIPQLVGAYVRQLTKELAHKMPHIEKIARLHRSHDYARL